jgi:citrate synthase
MSESKWQTEISKVQANEIRLRGYRVDELMGNVSFGQAIYLVLKGELPDESTGKIIDAILVSSIDHGPSPPSTHAAMTIASTGAPLNAAVASGILAISRFHGGAIKDCMGVLLQTHEKHTLKQISIDKAAEEIVEEYRQTNRRISGYGHRLHTSDPRTQKLFDLAGEYGIAETHINIAKAIETKLGAQLGKIMPINVDGAIATLLCGLDFPPDLSNVFFMISRISGMAAHVHEEKVRYKPMRSIDPKLHEYDGPDDRSLFA